MPHSTGREAEVGWAGPSPTLTSNAKPRSFDKLRAMVSGDLCQGTACSRAERRDKKCGHELLRPQELMPTVIFGALFGSAESRGPDTRLVPLLKGLGIV